MDARQLRAAAAAEDRLAELEMTQSQIGVDPKTWREFVAGEKWPKQARTRARIEASLKWKRGALSRIARGGDPALEVLDAVIHEQAHASDSVEVTSATGETLRQKRHRLILETIELELSPDQEAAMIEQILAKTAAPDHESGTEMPQTGTSGV